MNIDAKKSNHNSPPELGSSPPADFEPTPDVCILRAPSGDEAKFALPLDEALVKTWSGLAELWFADATSQGVPRIFGCGELKANGVYLLKGRAAPIDIVPNNNGSSSSSGSVPTNNQIVVVAAAAAASENNSNAPLSSSVGTSALITPSAEPLSSSAGTQPIASKRDSLQASNSVPRAVAAAAYQSTGRQPFKIIVVGDAYTGKTTFIKKYCKNQVDKSVEYKATLGFDFSMGLIRYKNEDIKLAFWDIAGQERFTNLTRSYYQGASGAFVVLDITILKTYEGARRWKADIDSKIQLKDGTRIPVILLANKSDKLKEGVAPAMDLDQFAQSNGFSGWLATSSFTNTNIKQAVTKLVEKMLEATARFEPPPQSGMQSERDASIKLSNDSSSRTEVSGCCGH